METKELTPGKFGVNFGLILGGVMLIISIIMYATDMPFKGIQWPVYLYYIAFPLTIIYTISQFKKQNNGLLSLGEAMKTGIVVALISALVYVLYVFIFNYVIDPTYNSKIIDFATEQIAASEAPVETKEAQLKMIEFFSSPTMGSVFWVAMSLFFGLLYSLIGGLVMKRANE
ncbi:DUF4199 domain-containing protein [Seonamhaeicola aphaedonensis]|uniref:Uncharacterized protein DUF4199 n=1 Tax=Seonamhaeicola aphaedonensis TaxID=1461338 RepID=A0A3D9H954_9FLAO|nr:DUF4199 domain-containing protein [Seonamhaeicola aphaedonensis]RED46014.1 uncharacterized protein DUF4199 [Seonamhaeicola aphaedonensis]